MPKWQLPEAHPRRFRLWIKSCGRPPELESKALLLAINSLQPEVVLRHLRACCRRGRLFPAQPAVANCDPANIRQVRGELASALRSDHRPTHRISHRDSNGGHRRSKPCARRSSPMRDSLLRCPVILTAGSANTNALRRHALQQPALAPNETEILHYRENKPARCGSPSARI